MLKHPIAIAFFLASALVAGNAGAADDTAAQCQKLLDAYGEIQVAAKQSALTAQVQAGIVQVCKRLIEAEKPVPGDESCKALKGAFCESCAAGLGAPACKDCPAPTPTPVLEEEKK